MPLVQFEQGDVVSHDEHGDVKITGGKTEGDDFSIEAGTKNDEYIATMGSVTDYVTYEIQHNDEDADNAVEEQEVVEEEITEFCKNIEMDR